MIAAVNAKVLIRRMRLRNMGTLLQQQQRQHHPEKSSLMVEAYPKLLEIFHNKASKRTENTKVNTIPTTAITSPNDEKTEMESIPIFPLFSPKVHDNIWKTVVVKDNMRPAAAILVPIVDYQGQPGLLFTERSSTMPTHASEVSYPGGHFDAAAGDHSLEDTALREAQEELSFISHDDDDDDDDQSHKYNWQSDVRLIGRASALPSMNGTPVTPVIAILTQQVNETTFPGHPKEVEKVFIVPLSTLLQVETWEQSPRFGTNIPAYPLKEHKIWGLTAVVTRPILHQLLKPAFQR
jgi:hypothetical protein